MDGFLAGISVTAASIWDFYHRDHAGHHYRNHGKCLCPGKQAAIVEPGRNTLI